jgi:hypothetical protein
LARFRISRSGIAGIEKISRDFRAYMLGRPEFTYTDINEDPWLDPIGRDYYLDRKALYFSPTDQDGIPIVVRGSGEAPFYRPTRVASFGLANWNRYRKRGDESCRAAFMNAAEWFMKFEEGRFVYRYELLDMKPPWLAGIAQGQGISLLTRAYLVTNDPRFLRQAQKAILPLSTPLTEGGLLNHLPDGSLFIEEYPQKHPTHILNGFFAAVFGISDLHRVQPSPPTRTLLNACWNTLVANIARWSVAGWSAYDLHNCEGGGPRNHATVAYHSLHIAQVKYAFALTGKHCFGTLAEEWEQSLRSVRQRLHAMAGKSYYRYQHPNRVVSVLSGTHKSGPVRPYR